MGDKILILRVLGSITIEGGEVLYVDESSIKLRPWNHFVASGHLVQVGYIEDKEAVLDATLPRGIGVIEDITWEEIESEGHTWNPPVYRCAGICDDGSRCEELIIGFEGYDESRYCAAHKGQEIESLEPK